MEFAPELVDRFKRDLETLAPGDGRLGLAVSGGPDSLGLLLLASAARPGRVEVATVDHALRPESRQEAETVAALCAKLKIPHSILTAEWAQKPKTALQEKARDERYRLLAKWAAYNALDAVVTGHHLDDQVETFLMRLSRGGGLRGLAAMRRAGPMPGSQVRLVRPLLDWRRAELEAICTGAGVTPIADPSNQDEQFERVRVRRVLAEQPIFDLDAVGRSIANLGRADAALKWATSREWHRTVSVGVAEILYRPEDHPAEIRRRIVSRAITNLATEGQGEGLRGRELDRLLAALRGGRRATLRGVLCAGGEQWRFTPAPRRAGPRPNSR